MQVKKNSLVCYEKHSALLDMDQLDCIEDRGFNISFILWGTAEVKGSELSEQEQKLVRLYRQTCEEMRRGLVSLIETYANQFK